MGLKRLKKKLKKTVKRVIKKVPQIASGAATGFMTGGPWGALAGGGLAALNKRQGGIGDLLTGGLSGLAGGMGANALGGRALFGTGKLGSILGGAMGGSSGLSGKALVGKALNMGLDKLLGGGQPGAGGGFGLEGLEGLMGGGAGGYGGGYGGPSINIGGAGPVQTQLPYGNVGDASTQAALMANLNMPQQRLSRVGSMLNGASYG